MVYRPTARVLTVLELLQAHGRLTGAALAERLEVDIRTVRSYIETIQDLGIPVEAERGRYGAYRLRPGFKLPPLIFSEDEALALTLSLLAARGSSLAANAPAVEGALAKVERVLPEATRARLQAVERTVVFEDDAARPAPPPATVATLSAAVQAGRSVHLRYRSARAQETERAFDPGASSRTTGCGTPSATAMRAAGRASFASTGSSTSRRSRRPSPGRPALTRWERSVVPSPLSRVCGRWRSGWGRRWRRFGAGPPSPTPFSRRWPVAFCCASRPTIWSGSRGSLPASASRSSSATPPSCALPSTAGPSPSRATPCAPTLRLPIGKRRAMIAR
ncbi:MAG: Helix-turn-helix, type 11 [uncultured Thermomicrobiales bacterium]|uniref:Helix-turn-helix, type 11 n=1 Tax=uncultured Thermomicrobiales bacterium TaxID=1645740 RepID=A0A6J4UNP4_9BACT|nr:MAG: Helix-turn-helix, type 11 [uncultured Thermomicrobiales bacterium]